MGTTKRLQDLNPSDITRAYKGKPGCMCGCRGQYWTHQQSSTMITKILRTIQANEQLLEQDTNWFAARVDNKEYVVYLDEA